VGDGGTILVTQNGGADWTAQESKTGSDLLSVAFVDASRGWAVGEGGRVYALTMPDMTPFEAAQTTAEMDKVFSDTGQRGNVPDELFQSYRAAKLAASQGKTAVEQYEQSLAQLSDGLVSKQGWEGIDWNANLNRIGVMAFLLFFVTILVSLYRYSMRMAAFYDSRADSLMLLLAWGDSAPGKIQDLDGAVKAISPDTYDFGKPPKNPVDQSIELAAKILDATKRRG
jgi:cbb3-type cytochrome oxidase subunit 3